MATRDNERAAAAAGVEPTRVKLGGFLLAGTIAGVAGALHVQLLHSLGPGQLPRDRQHHRVLHRGDRRAELGVGRRVAACCCSSTSRRCRPSATSASSSPAPACCSCSTPLPGGLGQVLRRAARPPARASWPAAAASTSWPRRPTAPTASLARRRRSRPHSSTRPRTRPSSTVARRRRRSATALSCRGVDLGVRHAPDRARLRLRRGPRRDGGPARHQRRRQVHRAQGHQRPARARPPATVALEGERHHRPAGRRARPPGPGPRARRAQRVPEPHRGREPAAGRLDAPPRQGRGWTRPPPRCSSCSPPGRPASHLPAGALSGGEQQMLGLAGSLITRPAGAADRRAVARPRPDGGGRAARRRARASTSRARPW